MKLLKKSAKVHENEEHLFKMEKILKDAMNSRL